MLAAPRRGILCWFSWVYAGGEFNLERSLDHLHDVDIEHAFVSFVLALYHTVTPYRSHYRVTSSATKPSYAIALRIINQYPLVFFPRSYPSNPEGKVAQQPTEGCRIVNAAGMKEKSSSPFTFTKVGFSRNKC